MWPTLKDFIHDFLFDKTFFVRASRSAIATLAASGLAFSEQIAAQLGAPGASHTIKVAAVVCTGLSLMLGAGDKTPPSVLALANDINKDKAARALDAPA